MICSERIEWIKNSKSLIATNEKRDDTGERKNRKRKDEEHTKKNDEDHKGTPASEDEVVFKEMEVEDAAKKQKEEEEMKTSHEYDTYYDTFIAAVKGSRLYN